MDEWDALKAAAEAARMSPCAKSKRGVVIFRKSGWVLAACSNAPPAGCHCDGSSTCRASCGKVAIHAEQAALLNCQRYGKPIAQAEMLHVKVALVNGVWKPVPSGGPSCPDCSKLILGSGIGGMWLYEDGPHGPRPVRYTAAEFHDLTLRNCGLHPYMEPTQCVTSPTSSASADGKDTGKTP